MELIGRVRLAKVLIESQSTRDLPDLRDAGTPAFACNRRTRCGSQSPRKFSTAADISSPRSRDSSSVIRASLVGMHGGERPACS